MQQRILVLRPVRICKSNKNSKDVKCPTVPTSKRIDQRGGGDSGGGMPDTALVASAAPPMQQAVPRHIASRPAPGGGGGMSAGLPLLRDPDHYEEINVIGNGKIHS